MFQKYTPEATCPVKRKVMTVGIESCIKSTISEAEVRSRLEDVRSYFIKNILRTSAYLYANGRDGEYSETAYLLSKTVHSFTHETQVKRREKERDEVQATLRDTWAAYE